MPNMITNKIKLYGADQRKIDEVIEFLRGDNGEVDFNKILPMPVELRDTVSGSVPDDAWDIYEAKVLGNTSNMEERFSWPWVVRERITTIEDLMDYIEKEQPDVNFIEYGKQLHDLHDKYGYHDWYEWSINNWGVKWNACEAKREENEITFYTPWDGVPNLMLEVSQKFPDIKMDYEYADEDYGANLAKYIFSAGEVVSEYVPEDYSTEAKTLAKVILGYDEPAEDEDGNENEKCHWLCACGIVSALVR